MTMPLPGSSVPTERELTPQRAGHGARRESAAPSPLAGMLWLGGWLFTVGFASLVWWKAVLAVLLWPYFLGVAIR